MFTALYPSFVLVKHDLLTPELNQRLAEIAIADAARHRVVEDADPRNLGTSDSPFGHIRHNLLAEHRGDVAVEAWLSVARAGVAEYLHRGFGAELPESLMAITEPFVQGDGHGETIGIFAHKRAFSWRQKLQLRFNCRRWTRVRIAFASSRPEQQRPI